MSVALPQMHVWNKPALCKENFLSMESWFSALKLSLVLLWIQFFRSWHVKLINFSMEVEGTTTRQKEKTSVTAIFPELGQWVT